MKQACLLLCGAYYSRAECGFNIPEGGAPRGSSACGGWRACLQEEEAECLPIVEDFNEDDDDEAASPTIPAHRQPQFEASSPTAFRPGLPGLPRLALPVKASPTVAGSGQQQAASDSGKPLTIPRLNLTSSMHSTLETRTASAELQVGLGWQLDRKRQRICASSILTTLSWWGMCTTGWRQFRHVQSLAILSLAATAQQLGITSG